MYSKKTTLIPLIASALIFSGCSNDLTDSKEAKKQAATPAIEAKKATEVPVVPQKSLPVKTASMTLRYVEFIVPESASTEIFEGKSGYEALVAGSKGGLYEMITSEMTMEDGIPATIASVQKLIYASEYTQTKKADGSLDHIGSAFEKEDVGLNLTATLKQQSDGSVTSNIEAVRTIYEGMTDGNSPQPIFSYTRVKTQLEVNFGSPVLIGRFNPGGNAKDKRSRIVFITINPAR